MVERGASVGSYQLEEQLEARGRCGVYRGVNRSRGEQARIKLTQDASIETSLLREAELLARVSHPGITKVLESGAREQGRHYLATELLEGEPLERRVLRAALDVREVLHLGQALCGAMAEVHRQQLVHRDLSPRTVFLAPGQGGRRYRPVVLHFDLAEDLRRPSPESLAGTPMYMAPEQLRGGPVDCRTDIYLLGQLLFGMLMRRPLFEAVPFSARLAAATTRQPRVQTGAWLPAALASVVDQCLEFAPEDRYSSMAELEHALRRLEAKEAGPNLR